MPQLDPAPWLSVFIFSWLVFLAFLPPKILAHTYPHEPTSQSTEKPKTEPWNWPWY